NVFNRFPERRCALRKGRSTPRSTGSKGKGGSDPAGGHRTTTGAPNITSSPGAAAVNSRWRRTPGKSSQKLLRACWSSDRRTLMFSDLYFRLRSLFRTKAVEQELDDELRFHYEREVEKYVGSGMSRQEAERRARL